MRAGYNKCNLLYFPCLNVLIPVSKENKGAIYNQIVQNELWNKFSLKMKKKFQFYCQCFLETPLFQNSQNGIKILIYLLRVMKRFKIYFELFKMDSKFIFFFTALYRHSQVKVHAWYLLKYLVVCILSFSSEYGLSLS